MKNETDAPELSDAELTQVQGGNIDPSFSQLKRIIDLIGGEGSDPGLRPLVTTWKLPKLVAVRPRPPLPDPGPLRPVAF